MATYFRQAANEYRAKAANYRRAAEETSDERMARISREGMEHMLGRVDQFDKLADRELDKAARFENQ